MKEFSIQNIIVYIVFSVSLVLMMYSKYESLVKELGLEETEMNGVWEFAIFTTILICAVTYLLGPLGAVVSLVVSCICAVIFYSHVIYLLQKSGDKFQQSIDKLTEGDKDIIYTSLVIASYPIAIGVIVILGLVARI